MLSNLAISHTAKSDHEYQTFSEEREWKEGWYTWATGAIPAKWILSSEMKSACGHFHSTEEEDNLFKYGILMTDNPHLNDSKYF